MSDHPNAATCSLEHLLDKREVQFSEETTSCDKAYISTQKNSLVERLNWKRLESDWNADFVKKLDDIVPQEPCGWSSEYLIA